MFTLTSKSTSLDGYLPITYCTDIGTTSNQRYGLLLYKATSTLESVTLNTADTQTVCRVLEGVKSKFAHQTLTEFTTVINS